MLLLFIFFLFIHFQLDALYKNLELYLKRLDDNLKKTKRVEISNATHFHIAPSLLPPQQHIIAFETPTRKCQISKKNDTV